MTFVIQLDPAILPSRRQLVLSAIAAVIVGVAVVLVAVIPAELGLDPTGLGRPLGLTAMGESKRIADEPTGTAAPAKVAAPPIAPVVGARADEVTVTLLPSQAAEVKLVMKAGDEIEYTWSTDRGRVNFDFHGDSSATPKEPSRKYERGAQPQAQGRFVAPFAGTHGWYWRNRTTVPMSVTLRTRGSYEKLVRLE